MAIDVFNSMIGVAAEGYDLPSTGAHNWADIFKSPTEDEKDRVSKVFWCTLNIGREVEKAGQEIRYERHFCHSYGFSRLETEDGS